MDSQTQSPYLLAPLCGINMPTDSASAVSNTAHMVITVTGSH